MNQLFTFIYLMSNLYILYYIISNAKGYSSNIRIQSKNLKNDKIKNIKYNYISSSDTIWNHGEVAWDSWENEINELQKQPLYIIELYQVKNKTYLQKNKNDVKNDNKNDIKNEIVRGETNIILYLQASLFGVMKTFYQEYLRKENYMIQIENIQDSSSNILLLFLSLLFNMVYTKTKQMEINELIKYTSSSSSNKNVDYTKYKYNDMNEYMKAKKISMSLFFIFLYIFVKNVGIAE